MALRLLTPVIVLAVCLTTAACDDSKPPTAPTIIPPASTPPAAPAPAPAGMIDTRTMSIVSGADFRPIPGATVTIGGVNYMTDAGGHPVGAEQYLPRESDVDVLADGHLRRETKASYGHQIILWPAADEQEMEAIRRMVYAREGSVNAVRRGFINYPLTVSAEGLTAEALTVWAGVIAEIRRTLEVEVDFYTFFAYDPNEVNMRPLGNPPQCTPVESLGFCREPNTNYVLYRMRPERTSDPMAVKRLIFSFFLGANPLPGFMNLESPGDTLSALELQTIRMIMQRPRTNRWPDSDR